MQLHINVTPLITQSMFVFKRTFSFLMCLTNSNDAEEFLQMEILFFLLQLTANQPFAGWVMFSFVDLFNLLSSIVRGPVLTFTYFMSL